MSKAKKEKCLNPGCGKKLGNIPGKRKKKYCNSSCRSLHFKIRARAEKEMKLSFVAVKVAIDDLKNDTPIFLSQSSKKTFDKITKKLKTKGLLNDVVLHSKQPEESYDRPELKTNMDEGTLWKVTQPASVKITTLQQVKDLCPKHLKGLERSSWISTARKKYNV